MSTPLTLPKVITDALGGLNPSASRRSFLASSGVLVLSLSASTLPGARVFAQAIRVKSPGR